MIWYLSEFAGDQEFNFNNRIPSTVIILNVIIRSNALPR